MITSGNTILDKLYQSAAQNGNSTGNWALDKVYGAQANPQPAPMAPQTASDKAGFYFGGNSPASPQPYVGNPYDPNGVRVNEPRFARAAAPMINGNAFVGGGGFRPQNWHNSPPNWRNGPQAVSDPGIRRFGGLSDALARRRFGDGRT